LNQAAAFPLPHHHHHHHHLSDSVSYFVIATWRSLMYEARTC